MAKRMKWFGDDVLRKIETGMRRNLETAAMYLRRDIVRSLEVPGPTKTHPEMASSLKGEPPHKRTGHLRGSIMHEVAPDSKSAKVGSFGPKGVVYARALELGARAHTVRPVRKKVLAWKGSGGEWHFAREVHIPALAPRPFLRPALDRNKRKLAEILGRRIR